MEPTVAATLSLDGSARRLDPRARAIWLVHYCALPVLVCVGLLMGSAAAGDASIALAGLAVLLLLGLPAVLLAFLEYRYWSWSTTEQAVELTHGIIVRHVSVVPYHRIQQIDIERSPLERMLGIATLVLRSAAATTDAKIPGVAIDQSDAFRQVLLDRSGSDDAV